MDFAILGPLEVRAGGSTVPIVGARHRALLTALLLDANRVVSVEGLVAALWPADDTPPTAVKAVQVYVSQLRKLLGEPDRIETRAPGYVLRVDADELDVERFERLVAQARETRDVHETSALLAEALGLWRGEPLADLVQQYARVAIERLAELRLTALEERIEADLALGRHAERVGELDALVCAHPLRERLLGQLMLALYRSGRQAQALETYQNARRALVDDLGLEPGPALQRLERAILTHDASLEGTAATAPAPPVPAATPTAERKVVTVLFADLVESTALGGKLDPERLRALLDRFYDCASAAIAATGGTIEKFAGDAVMAVFGAPVAQEDHADRALGAALTLRDAVPEALDGALDVRIGVNTGAVIVGVARAGSSFVTGDAVNVAARLEQGASAGEVLAGERTAAAAASFAFGPARTVPAKGKPDGITAYPLVSADAGARPAAHLPRTFVGRQRELERLLAEYRACADRGAPQLATIVGEPGVGKTSLARELFERLRLEQPEPLVRVGRCLSYGQGVTYLALAEVLRVQFGLLASDAPETVRARLSGREILALTLGIETAGDVHPVVVQERLHEAWLDLVEQVACERPLVLLVEDLHWAEKPLLDLLERLARDAAAPVLLLGTARPELFDRRPAWGSVRDSSTLWLEPLPPVEAEQMLHELLAGALPARLRRLVVEHSGGNPFFLEELLAALVDQGVLVPGADGWRAGDLGGITVPDSVQDVLAARIDVLPAHEKAALQAAAVIGRVFWPGPVIELLDGADADFALLEQRDFVRRRPQSSLTGEREYVFKHVLTREVAYATLPRARRARLHAAFAEFLERAGGGRDEDAPRLAHHYAAAADPGDADLAWAGDDATVERLLARALQWLQRAAELASQRYAIDEQIALLRRAADLEQRRRERAALLRELARAHAVNFDRAELAATTFEALALTDDLETQAALYAELAFGYTVRFQHAVDRPQVEEWVAEALERAPQTSAARVRALVAQTYLDDSEEESAAAEATTIAERLGDPALRSWAMHVRADAALVAGDYGHAAEAAAKRIDVLRDVDDPDHRADAYWSMIPIFCGALRFDDARRVAAVHDEVTLELTPHHRVHGVAVLLEVEELAADWERIRELTPRVERAVDAAATLACVHNPRSLLVCALAHACAGDDAEADRLERRTESLGIEGYGRLWETEARLALARDDLGALERLVEAESRRTDRTLFRVRKLAPVAARLDALAVLGRTDEVERLAQPLLRAGTYFEPFALRALGFARNDEDLLARAVERFEAARLAWHAAETPHLRELLTARA